MHKLLIGSVLAASALIAAPVLAQPAPPTPPGVAQGTAPPMRVAPPVLPANPRMRMTIMSDHVMTRDEVLRHVRELFTKLDANHDGFVTREEVEAFHQRFAEMAQMGRDMARRFEMRDLPMPDRAAMFDKLDTNHDGVISRQEYMAAKPEIRERRMVVLRNDGAAQPMPSMDGGKMEFRFERRGPMHGAMAMHAGMGFGVHLFEMADTNHDGRVSLQEAEAAALAHFDRADLNHDGKITPEERQQARTLRREHPPG